MHGIFRKGTLAALVIGLILGVVGLSKANYNIRQNADGTTDWVDTDANRAGIGGNPEVKVGRQYFMVHLTNISEAYTYYFASPISGILYSAFMVQNSQPVGLFTTSITFGVMGNLTPGIYVHPTTGGYFLIPPTVGLQGQIYYNMPLRWGQTQGRTPSDVTKMEGIHQDLRRGGIISIAIGGEGAPTNMGTPGEFDVWIIIDPR